jgi:hypothetical protein
MQLMRAKEGHGTGPPYFFGSTTGLQPAGTPVYTGFTGGKEEKGKPLTDRHSQKKEPTGQRFPAWHVEWKADGNFRKRSHVPAAGGSGFNPIRWILGMRT